MCRLIIDGNVVKSVSICRGCVFIRGRWFLGFFWKFFFCFKWLVRDYLVRFLVRIGVVGVY